MRERHARGAALAADAAERDRAAQAHGQSDGMRVLSYLLAGVLCYGGLGWLLDRWLHTGWLLPTGLVLGAGLGIYTVVRRFAVAGQPPENTDTADTADTTEKERR